MDTAIGRCNCGTPNVRLERIDGKVVVAVLCQKCNAKVTYDLDELLAILEDQAQDDRLLNWWPEEFPLVSD